MDVGGWLRSLGLGQYEAAFRENAIDDTVLPSLTAEDLGVGIVGHRRKLLDAIAALRADASARAPPPDALPATDRTAKDTAERRHLTVLFCDIQRIAARWRRRLTKYGLDFDDFTIFRKFDRQISDVSVLMLKRRASPHY